MMLANSPQAKGRVEGHDHAAQNRLPNDAIRFGVRDYDTPDHWSDGLYTPHINGKFSFEPAEGEELAFLDPSPSLSRVLGTRVGLSVDAITEELCAGARYACAAAGKRGLRDVSGAPDRRQPRYMPEDMSMEDAARDM